MWPGSSHLITLYSEIFSQKSAYELTENVFTSLAYTEKVMNTVIFVA
jgi:hypothetical protein